MPDEAQFADPVSRGDQYSGQPAWCNRPMEPGTPLGGSCQVSGEQPEDPVRAHPQVTAALWRGRSQESGMREVGHLTQSVPDNLGQDRG